MKVLIFKRKRDLAPVGGSNGYCYNIFNELKRQQRTDIFFLEAETNENDKHNTVKKYLKSFFRLLFGNPDIYFDEIKGYDVIHFHSTRDLYLMRKRLKRFKGLIVLTTHSPVPSHMEMTDNIKQHHKIFGKFLRKHSFSFIDRFAFKRADYILLPCKEAEESYFNHWAYYKKIHKKNEKKYVYIQTGINSVEPKISPEEYRKRIGIKKDDFVVSYVGRHNKVKGYDRLITISNLIQNKNIIFLIGGKEHPLMGPNKDNWKEIGWTNDPYSLIACSDVFVLPNRETYFDIVLLEVLSLGKTCIISRTGGNKTILDNCCDGIYGFNTENECASIIDKLEKTRPNIINNEIKELFSTKYSSEVFVQNYISFLERICKKII